MKPMFDLRDYMESSEDIEKLEDVFCMHCDTKRKAAFFLEFLHTNGRRWSSGTCYLDDTHWDKYKENTCYFFNSGTFGSINGEYNIKVLNFDNFTFNGADMKTEAKNNFFMKRCQDEEIL